MMDGDVLRMLVTTLLVAGVGLLITLSACRPEDDDKQDGGPDGTPKQD